MALSEANKPLLQIQDFPHSFSLSLSFRLPLTLPREAFPTRGYQREDEHSPNPARPHLSRVQVMSRDPPSPRQGPMERSPCFSGWWLVLHDFCEEEWWLHLTCLMEKAEDRAPHSLSQEPPDASTTGSEWAPSPFWCVCLPFPGAFWV